MDIMDKEYVTIECVECGAEGMNTYSEPYYTQMKERSLCFICCFWHFHAEKGNPAKLTVIDGVLFTPGNRTSGSFRGMAGRRFDIQYIAPSPYAGKSITTFDLWCSGQIPGHLRSLFPETAIFLNGAEAAIDQEGSLYAFNASQGKEKPFPLPHEVLGE